MKKLKFLTFFAVAVLLASLCFFNIGATSVTNDIIPLINKTFDATNITSGAIVVTQDVSTLAKESLGELGGKLEVNITYDTPSEANVTMSYKINPSSTISTAQVNGGISVEITFTIGDESAFTSLTITSATLTAYPETASPDLSPSPSDEETPTGSLPPEESPSDSLEPSPSATDVIFEPTNEPTKRPTVTPEPTKDNYTSNSQTQAPPTLSLPPNVTIDPNVTPVPEPTPVPFEKVSNSPSLSFTVFFLILVLLLAIDLFLIYWRKQMGYGVLINNGISRRKVQDDLVNTSENFENSDIEDEISKPE